MGVTIYVILKFLFDFALEVWFSTAIHIKTNSTIEMQPNIFS